MTFGFREFRTAANAVMSILALTIAHRALGTAPIETEPLASPKPGGKTMFTQLPPESTGVVVTNNYADPLMWGRLYQEFENGSMGTGVCIGDYDGDGRPDIFVVSKCEGCHLFRNLGGYRFEDVTEKAGVGTALGIWNGGATFVDINNDGRLDLYVCRFNAPNLLFVNQGDGTFKEMAHAYGLDVVDASVAASFCDYDRDGWLDLYVATNLLDSVKHPNGQRGYLFHNNRNGTFSNVTDRAGIAGEAQSHSATWWDFDNDGWPDLYVANDFGVPDKLYHNNRDGTFSDVLNQVLPHTTFSSMGSDIGDVNNDGLVDLMVADMVSRDHVGRQRSAATWHGVTEKMPEGLNAAPKFSRNTLFVNTGEGHCLEAAYLAGVAETGWTWSVRFEDLDNDGLLDLYVTNGMNREQTNVDQIARVLSAESIAERIRIARDSPPFPETHFAFKNLGDLKFESVGPAWGLDQKGISFGAATGDLNGDGNMDIVVVSYQTGVTILRNDCSGTHRANVFLRGTASNRFGIGATVKVESTLGTQVRTLSLSRGYMSSSEPMIHFGLGSDTVIKRMTVTWPSGNVQVFENLPVDRRFTITEAASASNSNPTQASIATIFEDVTEAAELSTQSRESVIDETDQQRLLPVRLNRRGPAMAANPIDAGGRDSIVVGGTTLDPLRILRGISATRPAFDATIDDGPVLLFDSRGIGLSDLLVTKGGDALPEGAPQYQPRLYFNDGQGGFVAAPDDALPELLISAGAVAAADFEHNGRLGLFIGGRLAPFNYPNAPRSAILANRGGKFEDVTDRLAPALRNIGMVTSALWTDVDGDGWVDLMLTLDWGGVKYFHNNRGKGFEDWSERAGFAAAGTGWWTSIAAADFNGDGRIDYVVGNVGLNTQYHADPAHPALLFSGDFKGDGSTELIEAYYEGDHLYPWRSRGDLGAVIPSILKRYPRNDNYARATLSEIVGQEKLARAKRLEATELQSGIFLSQPDGTYHFEPLPRIAQIATIQGMIAGSILGDGHADIYAVQGPHAGVTPVSHNDGGLSLLLRGDGKGHFDPAPPRESGLIVPGNAKALVVLDLMGDAWPGFLVSRNNDSSLAFRNKGVKGNRPLKINLRGPAGNPSAVGAKISVTLSDGSVQTSEVYAGSGYYSQSPASCYFGYPVSNPPTKIAVRWPDGLNSEYNFYSGSPKLVFDYPQKANDR